MFCRSIHFFTTRRLSTFDSDALRIFYSRAFPYEAMFKWLRYYLDSRLKRLRGSRSRQLSFVSISLPIQNSFQKFKFHSFAIFRKFFIFALQQTANKVHATNHDDVLNSTPWRSPSPLKEMFDWLHYGYGSARRTRGLRHFDNVFLFFEWNFFQNSFQKFKNSLEKFHTTNHDDIRHGRPSHLLLPSIPLRGHVRMAPLRSRLERLWGPG